MLSTIVSLIWAFILHGVNGEKVRHCVTEGCVHAAANLLNSIDKHADPCQDFHQFACGKWERDHHIPDDKSSYNQFSVLRDKITQQMRTILEDDSDGNANANSIRFAKALYKECMNTDQIESLKSKPVHSFLNSVGGWPVMNSTWKDVQMDVTELSIQITRQSFGSIFTNFHVTEDVKNGTNYILEIHQTKTFLRKDYFRNDTKYGSKIAAYKELFVGIVSLIASDMNISVSADRVLLHWTKLLEFERQLAKIYIKPHEKEDHNLLYNKFNLRNFSALIDVVNWTHYLESTLEAEVFDRVIKHQEDRFEFIVVHPEFFRNLQILLSSTEKEIIFDYMIWRALHSLTGTFDERFKALNQKFRMKFRGIEEVESRWKTCSTVASKVEQATGALYVRNFFTKEDKHQANIMVDHLKRSFKNIVYHTQWMDNQTQKQAIEKVNVISEFCKICVIHSRITSRISTMTCQVNFITSFIGYPDLVMNDSALDDYYKNLSHKENSSYFEMLLTLSQWIDSRNYFKLLKQVDKNEFQANPAVVNAYYSDDQNSITFPAAILQPPFFHYDYPKYVTYGTMGAIIGHEITHGFDSTGHQYDKSGILQNWWSASSKEQFEQRTKCIRNQYGEYVEPSTQESVDGNLTVGENIADNGGLKIALSAYKEYTNGSSEEECQLPGMNLTIYQAFFASYAMFWCGNTRKENMQMLLKTDSHSPRKFRINGPLSNIPDFAKAYGCPKGSPMNPDKKCSVW